MAFHSLRFRPSTSGASGTSGSIGVSGYSGTSGFSGASTSGFSGASGAPGATSASGFSGTSGTSGTSGFSGTSGTSGVGTSGFSGTSGTSGTSGYSGISGVSGFSGVMGGSGTSGYLPVFTGATTLGNSIVYGISGNVGIGTTAPGSKLSVDAFSGTVLALSRTASGYNDPSLAPWISWNSPWGPNSGGIRSGNSWSWDTQLYGDQGLSLTGNGYNSASPTMVITTTGNVGIGVTSPTASLHLKAGTATANTAPIKLTSGVVNTVPVAGCIEFDGVNYYMTV